MGTCSWGPETRPAEIGSGSRCAAVSLRFSVILPTLGVMGGGIRRPVPYIEGGQGNIRNTHGPERSPGTERPDAAPAGGAGRAPQARHRSVPLRVSADGPLRRDQGILQRRPAAANRGCRGPVMSLRRMGKASFCHLQDAQGRIQVYLKRDDLGESYDAFRLMDIVTLSAWRGSSSGPRRGRSPFMQESWCCSPSLYARSRSQKKRWTSRGTRSSSIHSPTRNCGIASGTSTRGERGGQRGVHQAGPAGQHGQEIP